MSKISILIIICCCVVFSLPFFSPGYFPTHNGGWAVVRLAEMVREIKDLQIPPRWADYLNHGYGYPLFHFTYPLPYYLGTVLKILGFSLVDSIKALFLLSVFISAIFMYFLGKKLTGNLGGFISATFYIIAPYRLSNLYIRGSLGESLSLIFFPILFLLSIKLVEHFTPRIFSLTAISLACLILTHNVSALLFLPVWLGFIAVYATKLNRKQYAIFLKRFLLVVVLGFSISSFFFLPALVEKKYILLGETKIADLQSNFLTFSNYIFDSTINLNKPIFNLGLFQIITALLPIVILKSKKGLAQKTLFFFVVSIIGYILLSQSVTYFLWTLPPLLWIDFPWRIVNVLIFLIACASAYVSQGNKLKWLGLLLLLFSVYLNLKYVSVSGTQNNGDMYYSTNDATTTSADELMPVWVLDKPKDRYNEKAIVVGGDIGIKNLSYRSNHIAFETNGQQEGLIKINTIYFPGWNFYIDEKLSPITYAYPTGEIHIKVPNGDHKIKGVFEDTLIRKIANLISCVTIFPVLYFLLLKKKNAVYEHFI